MSRTESADAGIKPDNAVEESQWIDFNGQIKSVKTGTLQLNMQDVNAITLIKGLRQRAVKNSMALDEAITIYGPVELREDYLKFKSETGKGSEEFFQCLEKKAGLRELPDIHRILLWNIEDAVIMGKRELEKMFESRTAITKPGHNFARIGDNHYSKIVHIPTLIKKMPESNSGIKEYLESEFPELHEELIEYEMLGLDATEFMSYLLRKTSTHNPEPEKPQVNWSAIKQDLE